MPDELRTVIFLEGLTADFAPVKTILDDQSKLTLKDAVKRTKAYAERMSFKLNPDRDDDEELDDDQTDKEGKMLVTIGKEKYHVDPAMILQAASIRGSRTETRAPRDTGTLTREMQCHNCREMHEGGDRKSVV